MAKRERQVVLTPEQKDERRKARQAQKHANFVRIANRRVPAALKHLQYVHNLSNLATYAFSDAEALAVTNILTDAVESIRMAFENRNDAKDEKWQLPHNN